MVNLIYHEAGHGHERHAAQQQPMVCQVDKFEYSVLVATRRVEAYQTRGRRRLGGVMGSGDAPCGWVVPALCWRRAPAAPYEGVSGGRLAAVGLPGHSDLQGLRAASAG
jgi:hypothetical protein